jgi:hypothetical protein
MGIVLADSAPLTDVLFGVVSLLFSVRKTLGNVVRYILSMIKHWKYDGHA